MKPTMEIAVVSKQSRIDPAKTSVIILAAGHGNRMRPLTDNLPKPLLKVAEHSLIEHHIHKLSAQGFKHIVINTAYLGNKIQQHLGNGERYDIEIRYSDESSTGALETAGGIKKSLSLIDSDPFLVVNADIYSDFDFSSMLEIQRDKLGCIVLVPNPVHNPAGDFIVNDESINTTNQIHTNHSMTFSGIALYREKIFSRLPQGKLALGPILKKMISNSELLALPYYGGWTDVGTPERLNQLNASLRA